MNKLNSVEHVTIGLSISDSEATSATTIKSVPVQTYRHIILILANVGSNDYSIPVAQEYADEFGNVQLINDGFNRGLIYG